MSLQPWHARNRLVLGKSFSDGSAVAEYEPSAWMHGTGWESRFDALRENVAQLVQSLMTLRSNLDLTEEGAEAPQRTSSAPRGEEIFIVHGRTHRDAVARVVEQATTRRIIILQEQPDGGSTTVIEKLERQASRAGYAVVILSGDDEGRLRGSDTGLHPRARQNVIAELGYFIALLGRGNVKALYEPGVEVPSDFGGVTYIELDEHDAWRDKLIRELRAMGL